MTIVEVMDTLADFIRETVRDYNTVQAAGELPIDVYAGYPPIQSRAQEKRSFIWVFIPEFKEKEGESTVTVDFVFSIYDEDREDGWRHLANLMEHVRQAIHKTPCVKGRALRSFPIEGQIPDAQPFPQWEGTLRAAYIVGQPTEEGIIYDDIYGN